MAQTSGSTGLPGSVEWQMTNSRTGEVRTFSQTALTIDGEARLLALVHSTAQLLNEDGFPWDALGPLFDPTSDVDWLVAANLLGVIGNRAPDSFAELATILLSIYPTNEDGTKNDQFDASKRFLRSSIRLATIVDMVKVFTEQNDYQRLADPIGAILGRAARPEMAETSTRDISPVAETTAAS